MKPSSGGSEVESANDRTGVGTDEIAAILVAMAKLMDGFRQSDLALQKALSSLATRANSSPEMKGLQHIDLITQTHGDLANFLPALANAVKSGNVDYAALRDKLALQSLQDTLIDAQDHEVADHTPGELSLF